MRTTLTLSTLMLATALPVHALEDGVVTIWTGANRDKAQLEGAAAIFTEELGIEVRVEVVDPDLPQNYQKAAATGDGPDIVMWAHDRFGEWASGGLIQPVAPSAAWRDGILPAALEAVQFDGKTWGYPVAVEAVTLIYNTDLVDTPPESFEALAEAGEAAILWDYNNAYFTMPLLMANGGYAFEKIDGVYDGTTTGVNAEGSVAGAQALRALFDAGVMPQGVDYGVMDGAMANGDVAMVLNGPWSWPAYQEAGISIAVAPIPTVAGNAAPPFLGVQALAINAASPNADLAVELIENYLLTDEGLAGWNANGALGALADISAAEAQQDPLVSGMLAVAADGVPMPSNPEMGAFWAAMAPALTNITSGTLPPEKALDDAAARILSE
ncbi:MAG: maltose/maltodextrin ABC transporter substrate-binding protein MalE [Pseudomonadota bacterium]